jgi:peptide/nickel transport system permease protein
MTSVTQKQVVVLREKPQAQRSLTGDALRRLMRNPLAIVGLVIVLVMVLGAIFAEQIAPYSPIQTNLRLYVQPPSAAHFLGTDDVGRDVFARIIYGARISLQVSIFSILIGSAIGTPLGMAAGFYGGTVDTVIMRVTDVFLAFPLLLLAIALVAAIGPGQNSAFIALGIAIWPYFARLIRGQALSLKNYDYVTAARSIGAGDVRILALHMLPNMLTPIIVYATVQVAAIILSESALAFLGLGAQPPTPSWGGMLADTRSFLTSAPWLPTYPGIAIFLASLGFNLLGDGLRDALDVKQR